MKKLKLKALELGSNEVLTRAQLKNVLGGTGSGIIIAGVTIMMQNNQTLMESGHHAQGVNQFPSVVAGIMMPRIVRLISFFSKQRKQIKVSSAYFVLKDKWKII